MSMAARFVVVVLAGALLSAVPVRAANVDPQARVVPEDALQQMAQVRDVEVREGTVTGTLVNLSGKVLRDVELRVDHEFLWKNEHHPGPDSPSHVSVVRVAQDIPPGGSVRFTAPADLEPRRDGRYVTRVEVTEMLAFEPTGHLSGAPAPGVTRSEVE